MNGVLVLGELARGALAPVTLELITAGRALSEQGAGALSVALLAAEEAHVQAVNVAGVQEIVAVPSPCAGFEAHVAQAALEALIRARRPAVVLAGHTVDSLGFAPAVAARGRHGFASDVIALSVGEDGLRASRSAYGGRLIAELDFPGKDTVLLLLRAGAFAPASGAGTAAAGRLELALEGRARSEHVESREPPAADLDITRAEFLLSIGRGIEDRANVARFAELAERMGAALAVSAPLVEAGWVTGARKVGLSGRTVAPRVYLALGISGAAPHLAGISGARTIIAVNTDPGARIFDVAHYGAVADLFEVATELEREFASAALAGEPRG
jgi:electron transfer flavoprotein alpha subunit